MREERIAIEGMSCHHCVMAVRRELDALPGVQVRDVQIGSATVVLDDAAVSAERLRSAIERAGYRVRV